MSRKMARILGGGVMALMLTVTPALSFAQDKVETPKATPKRVDLKLAMRNLWGDHIFWIRNVALTTKLGDTEAAKVADEQVVQNAKAIAEAVVPYYGKAAGDKLFTLLAGHYGSVKDFMSAAFSANKAGMDSAKIKMINNAKDIAVFLSSANPNWPEQTLLGALGSHGALHMAQIEQIHAKNFAAEAKIWEQEKAQVFQIADVLSEGIVKQFPQKFA